MPHAIRSPFKLLQGLIILSLLSLQVGCALFEDRAGPPTSLGPRDQVYTATYEEVWKAVNLVLQPYPLRVSNMDQGILETDVIRGFRIWSPPYKKAEGSGETYKLSIRVVKGNVETRAATKVIINKDMQLALDFFSDPRPKASDGLEEKSILYRIGREIQIDHALARAQKKQNQNQSKAK